MTLQEMLEGKAILLWPDGAVVGADGVSVYRPNHIEGVLLFNTFQEAADFRSEHYPHLRMTAHRIDAVILLQEKFSY